MKVQRNPDGSVQIGRLDHSNLQRKKRQHLLSKAVTSILDAASTVRELLVGSVGEVRPLSHEPEVQVDRPQLPAGDTAR
jgi:hypothetical protein